MIIEISDEHAAALEAINSSYYNNDDLGETVEDMIEEHLIREHGMVGKFTDGHFEP